MVKQVFTFITINSYKPYEKHHTIYIGLLKYTLV